MNLLKKLFSFSIGSIVTIIIGVISTPIITRIIEPDEFGIATIFMSVGSLIGIISLAGLDQAFVRFFYETNRINLLKKCFTISVIITGIVIIFVFIFAEDLSSYISPNSSYALLMILYIISMLIFRFSSLILRMMQFGYRYSLIQILQKLLDLIFIFSIANLFFSNRYTLIISSILTLLILSILTLFFSRSFWFVQDDRVSKIINYKELIIYSFPLLISSFMTILFQTLDKLFLNLWVTSSELGIYAATFKIIAILNVIQGSFTLFWVPASLEHYKFNPNDKDFFSRISKLLTVTMMTICIVVVMFKDVLVLFLGPEYREASSLIALLVLMPVMYTMSETTIIGVNFSLKSYLHIIISGIALIINVILCVLLIPKFGMHGAAISVSLSYVVFYLVRTYFGMKNFKFDNKLAQTLVMIISIILWVIVVVATNDQIILIMGGILLFLLLCILFFKEIIESLFFLLRLVKRKYK